MKIPLIATFLLVMQLMAYGHRWFWLAPADHFLPRTVFIFTYAALLTLAFALYGFIVQKPERNDFFFPLALALSFVFMPHELSSDLGSYVAHGTIANQTNGNPYLSAPGTLLNQPVRSKLDQMHWDSEAAVTPYGPMWSLLEKTSVILSPDNPYFSAFFLKLIAFFSYLGVLLLFNFFPSWTREERVARTALFAWNPFILFQMVLEAHNDALTGFLILLALSFVGRNRWFGAKAFLWGAVLVKIYPLILFPPLLVREWRARQSKKELSVSLLVFVVFAALTLLLCALPFWAGVETFNGIRMAAAFSPITFSGILARFLPNTWVSVLMAFGLVAFVAYQSFYTRYFSFLAIASFYFYICSGRFWAWYAILPVCLLIAYPITKSNRLVLILSFFASGVVPLSSLKAGEWLSVREAGIVAFALSTLAPVFTLTYFIFVRDQANLKLKINKYLFSQRSPDNNEG